MTIEITDANFQEKVSNHKGVALVYFGAQWCGPCRSVGPVVDALSSEFDGRALVGKVNTDTSPQLASDCTVTAVPTVLIFKDGKVVEKCVGINPKDRLAAVLNRHLSS